MAGKILITGLPKSGKTTLIKKLASRFYAFHPSGFYTEEIVEERKRVGFRLVSLESDKTEYLAHINFKSGLRVGKYGINLTGFENFLKTINFSKSNLVFIDEIGKMECFSNLFIMLIRELLSSEKLVVATVGLKGGGLIAEVKKMPSVSLYYLTQENRKDIYNQVESEIKREIGKNL